MELKQFYNKIYPREEEQKEIIDFIEGCVASGYKAFKESYKEMKGKFGDMIMKFAMMPKTELHDKFQEKIRSKIQEEEIKKQENYKRHEVKKTKENDQVRKIIKITKFRDGESIAHIGYPYYDNEKEKDRVSGSVLIYKKKHPNVYEKCLKLPIHEGKQNNKNR